MNINNKYIVSILSASLIVIFFTYGIKYYLETSSYKLTEQINIIEKNIYNDNLEKAKKEMLNLEKLWSDTEPKWSFLANHLHLEHIITCLKEATTFIEFKDIPNTISNLRLLKQHIKHIPEIEEFNLKNIL